MSETSFSNNLLKYVQPSDAWLYDSDSLLASIMAEYEQAKREAVLSALDDLRAKVEQINMPEGTWRDGYPVARAEFLRMIKAQRSALETPK